MFFDVIAPFLIGLVGSLHCLGMCGPLVMAYSLQIRKPGGGESGAAPASWSEGISHHLSFHLGRVFTYGLLGALAAGLAHLAGFSPWLFGLRGSITLGGGFLMIAFGLILLKVLPFPVLSFSSMDPKTFFGRIFPPLFRSRSLASKAALGLATGFLPCMLSWAMVVRAGTTQNFLQGFLTMVFFGLGTFPALFLAGVSASLFSLKVRLLGERVAAVSLILMGFILILKGVRFFVY